MALFSSKEPKPKQKTPIDSLAENTMFTVIRESKRDARELLAKMGDAKFIAHGLAAFDTIYARIPDPIQNVEYRLIKTKDGLGGDVAFFFHIVGNSAILNHLGTQYRLHGHLGIEGHHMVHIHYRESLFGNPHQLNSMFQEDIDHLRAFESEVESALRPYREELRRQLKIIAASMEVDVEETMDLTRALDHMGYRRKE